MAHITSLTVSGLAGRKHTYSKHLHRHLNVFFGPNGSGKTSLLKLLDSAMVNNASLVANVPFDAAEVTIYTIDHDMHFSRLLDAKFKQELGIAQAVASQKPPTASPKEYAWTTRPDDTKVSGPYKHRFLPITRFLVAPPESQLYTRHGNSEDDLNQQFTKAITDLWRRYTAVVNASVARVQQSGLAKIFQNVLLGSEPSLIVQGPKDPKTAYERLQSFLARSQGFGGILPPYDVFSARYAREPRLQTLANEILEIEKLVEAAVAPRHRIQTLLEKMFSKEKTIAFSDAEIDFTVSEKLRIGLGALSSGEKQLIRIFVDTLLAEENSILIDEPELSMHIDWQRVLLQSMRELNPRCQIIVATHSPEIMAEIPNENIFEI